MLRWTLIVAVLFTFSQGSSAQNYQLPNNNAGCPSTCRQIPWLAGSDIWNGGTLPNYTSVTCSAAVADGVTDQTTNIQNCINAASAGQAVFLPVASNGYFVNGTVRLKSSVVLRGSMPGTLPETRIFLGSSGLLTTQNFSTGANLNPPIVTYGAIQPTFTLSGSPQKGDTTVTCATGCANVSVGSYIKIFGNDDPALIGDASSVCSYCGDNSGSGSYMQQQVVKVTNIVGSVFTFTPQLYYTFYSPAVTITTGTEPAGIKYNVITYPTTKAGFEYFHIIATQTRANAVMVQMQGCLFCWYKGVESQFSGTGNTAGHLQLVWTYGNEVRDNYIHEQRDGSGGAGYGIWLQQTDGDDKIENNIVRHNRHGLINEGCACGGEVWLYNYVDDEFTDDLTYLGSARGNHGAHPFMHLWEGNIIAHLTAGDDFHGTSSHLVFFRNSLWGDYSDDNGGCSYNSGTGTNPSAASCTTVPTTGGGIANGPINSGFDAVDVYNLNTYFAFVGNVLGRTGMTGNGDGRPHTNWANATISLSCDSSIPTCGFEAATAPGVYSYGAAQGSIPSPKTTSINQGNWDFKTNGIAINDGGANDNFAASWYYTSKPAFLGTRPFPLIGSDLTGGNLSGTSGKVNTNPAYDCYWTGPASGSLHSNKPFNPTGCYTAGPPPTANKPTFSLSTGTYLNSQPVSISTTSTGAIICYNTTGNPATNGGTGCTTGTLYSGPVTVSVTEHLYAVAGGTGFTDSSVASISYVIGPTQMLPQIFAVDVNCKGTVTAQ